MWEVLGWYKWLSVYHDLRCKCILGDSGTLQDTHSQGDLGLGPNSPSTMCYYEEPFHKTCGHWGNERFVGDPCCRSKIVVDRHVGCDNPQTLGAVNAIGDCPTCKRRVENDRRWMPFQHVSNEGWAVVADKVRKRSEDLGAMPPGESALDQMKDYSFRGFRNRDE